MLHLSVEEFQNWYGCAEVMELPAQEMELARGQMVIGELSFSEAVGRLVKKYKSFSEER